MTEYTGKWYIGRDNRSLCFDINNLYTYEIQLESLTGSTMRAWLEHLRYKRWFFGKIEKSFVSKFLEMKQLYGKEAAYADRETIRGKNP